MISQLSLHSDNIQAVRLEEDVLMGPPDSVYVSNQPSGQKGNKVDLISQEKKKILKRKQTQNWRTLPVLQSFQKKQPICIHAHIFSPEGSLLLLLLSLGNKWQCGTSVNGSIAHRLNTLAHQEVPPDWRKAAAAMFLLLFSSSLGSSLTDTRQRCLLSEGESALHHIKNFFHPVIFW